MIANYIMWVFSRGRDTPTRKKSSLRIGRCFSLYSKLVEPDYLPFRLTG